MMQDILEEFKEKQKESQERIKKLSNNYDDVEQSIRDIRTNVKSIYNNFSKMGISVPWEMQEKDICGPLDERLKEIRELIVGETGCLQALNYVINRLESVEVSGVLKPCIQA